jgi:GH25 family lysozyme M1 (1,4-beta-N-acetylmuramidase)
MAAVLGALLGAFLLAAPDLAHRAVDVRAAAPPSNPDPALPHGPRMLQQLSDGPRPQLAAPSGLLSGVDVASFQHPNGAPINWSQVAAAGYSFAFIKATEGNYYANGYFATDYAEAASAGLYRSAYAFAAPNASDGVSQADYLLDHAPYALDGRSVAPAVDLEWDPYDSTQPCWGVSTGSMVSWIGAFVNEVELRIGKPPLIYTAASWWNQCAGGSGAFTGEPLWVASYGSSSPSMPAGWSNWTFWQWTSSGTVPGIAGSGTDLDYVQGGAGTLAALAGQIAPSWSPVSGSLASGPAASSWAWNRVDVFARGQDAALYHWIWGPAGWAGPERLGGLIAAGTGPAVAAWAPNRLDIFVEGVDGGLWHLVWSGAWSSWEPLGGGLTSSPTAASWGSGRLDVFVRGGDRGLWHLAWDNSWSPWQGLGGGLSSAPGATSWGYGRIDTFVRGLDGALWHVAWQGGWSGWQWLGGGLGSAAAASSWGAGRLDVIALDSTGAPYHLAYAGGWGQWTPLGGFATADPAIVDRATGLADAFVRGGDNQLWFSPVPP